MRRALVALAVLLALGIPVASAQTAETPQGTFTSATRAVAGAPIFVRSITPCPPSPVAYRWAQVWIADQTVPSAPFSGVESTTTDLRPDGSWELTISAPVDMPDGITKSYSVHAQCIAYDGPYVVESGDAEEGEGATPDLAASYFRYFLRPLYVTGFGPSEVAEGEGPSGTTSTTSASTTTSLAPPTTLAAAGLSAAGPGKVADRSTTSETAEDPTARWEATRRELAASGDTTARLSLAAADGTSSQARPPVDGGIPWWAFALAAILAVSGVVAFGVRRTSALSQLDR